MRQFETIEIALQGEKPQGSCVDVDVTAVITGVGFRKTFKGFYAGNGTYKVRFLPSQAGTFQYHIFGCVEGKGSLLIEPADGTRHGIVHTKGEHFVYEDGTSYYPFGTTVYALVHQTKDLIDQTMESLAKAPFNKIRFCVFPKNYEYNHNEPQHFAFEKDIDGNWDVNTPCFAFWDALEDRIRELAQMGIEADLILFHPYDKWGFDRLTQKDNLVYLDYVIRRLSAFPNIWWSIANEYDLSSKSLEDWEEIEEFVAANDPWKHLLSCHNCFSMWDASRKNITHISIQTKVFWNLAELRKKYHKPVILDECCYEGNLSMFWGCISGHEMVRRFWRAIAAGAYCTHGETFLDLEHEIIWWAKGGRLKGESPERIGFLRTLLESLSGPLEALPDYFEEAARISTLPPDQQEKIFSHSGSELRGVVKGISRMNAEDMHDFVAMDYMYHGHCGESCYLYFYDIRTCAECMITLPESHTYRVEVIDVWNMTRETVKEHVNGIVTVSLPGKEDIAVLAIAE